MFTIFLSRLISKKFRKLIIDFPILDTMEKEIIKILVNRCEIIDDKPSCLNRIAGILQDPSSVTLDQVEGIIFPPMKRKILVPNRALKKRKMSNLNDCKQM